MKNNLIQFLFLSMLFLFSCSEEEMILDINNLEAFAFQLDGEWELNATAQISGFKQIEDNGMYTAKLSYYTDLITPLGERLKEVDYGLIDKEDDEKITETTLDVQIILDSSFTEGEYRLKLFVMDDLAGQLDSAETTFSLSQ